MARGLRRVRQKERTPIGVKTAPRAPSLFYFSIIKIVFYGEYSFLGNKQYILYRFVNEIGGKPNIK